MSSFPCLVRSSSAGEPRYELGDPLVDSYLAFVVGRARPNTLRATAHDLKTFFTVIDKGPVEVAAADVFAFLAHQRGHRTVVRISDGESGLSARTIARRLSTISGLYAYLIARGDTGVESNPVPRGLSTRRRGGRRQHVPLVRVPRTLPKVLAPPQVNALLGALRTDRDRAMVYAMVVLQAVEHAQSDPGNQFVNFARALKADQQRLDKLELGIADVLARLSELELARPRGMRAPVFTAGEVDRLMRTAYRIQALGDGVTVNSRPTDVAIEIARHNDGSVVVFPAMSA